MFSFLANVLFEADPLHKPHDHLYGSVDSFSGFSVERFRVEPL